MKQWILALLTLAAFQACNQSQSENHNENKDNSDTTNLAYDDSLWFTGEKHLRNIRQLTFGGDNAEAYWSFDDSKLIFQRTWADKSIPCDQIFYGEVPQNPEDSFTFQRISNGLGRTTCAYFLPGDTTVLYASTFKGGNDCPPVPESGDDEYVWPIFNDYEIYISDLQGNIIAQLTDNEFYDAEATVSPKGDKIVFTSNRSGDLELYTMNLDGSDVRQITDELGYDGGAFFSPDGSKIIFRASRPTTDEEQQRYKNLLARGLVEPTNMELFVCNADGSDLRQITHLGGANWAPFFHPSGEKVIFSSNHEYERGFPFELFMINLDGTGLERITFDNTFTAFPMFSNDGKKIVFASNRNNGGTRYTNLFIADWVE